MNTTKPIETLSVNYVREYNPLKVAVHWTHRKRIKKLYQEGFSIEELAIMYRLPYWYIKSLSRGVKRMERI